MASGNSLLSFGPLMNEPPVASYATIDQRNGRWVLDFDAAAQEAAIFSGFLPRHYTGLGITVVLVWCATSATSGNVVWGVSFERNDTSLDIDADSWGGESQVTAATDAVSGGLEYSAIPFTNSQIDGLLAGESFRFRVRRIAADGSDTMAGDAELVGIELRET